MISKEFHHRRCFIYVGDQKCFFSMHPIGCSAQHGSQCNQSASTQGDTLRMVGHTDIGHFSPHKSALGGGVAHLVVSAHLTAFD